jgi:hypothetical protein
MRRHGVPNFPDPDSNGSIAIVSGTSHGRSVGIDTNSAQFKKANQACQRLLPNGGRADPQESAREREAALKFARCMRSH